MLAILDYDAGNMESVRLALRHVGGSPVFVRTATEAEPAERIVFPGVGSAAHCMRNIRERGFDGLLKRAIAGGKPVLAICIGMQLLFEQSDEDGGISALGILPGRVVRFMPRENGARDKVPHMGWNHVAMPRPHPLLANREAGGDFYFVHSYHVSLSRDGKASDAVYGTTGYAGVCFPSMVGKGSLFAAQFHPEKSGEAGLALLARFLEWDGGPC